MNETIDRTQGAVNEALTTTLLANLAAFQAFARKRLRDDHLAADAVQEGLLRALKAAPRLSEDSNLVAWFYRILRNVLVDLHRARARERKGLEAAAVNWEANEPELERVACACLKNLLPTLKPEYAAVVQAHDLQGQPAPELADALGISRNLLKVRLHRARRQLRSKLEQTCRTCATHGCSDCSCEAEEAAQ